MPEFPPFLRPPKNLPAGAAVLAALGFSVAAILNQGVGRLFVLADDAEYPEFEDAEAAPEGGPQGPGGMMPGMPPGGMGGGPMAMGAPDEVGQGPASGGDEVSPRPGRRALPKQRYVDAIVRRNIFDSTAVYNPETAQPGSDECKESSSKLLATVVADPPEYSSALIAESGGRAHGFAIGDELGGEGRIASIEPKKVCMDGGGCLCVGGAVKLGSAAPATQEKGSDDDDVKKLSENRYQVSADFVENQLANIETLATQVRVVPHKGTDGQVDGYRLSAIRKNSVFDKLGIKNGDIISAVNGQSLTSTESALSSYQSLKNERAFSFELTRRNQKQTLEYEVR